MKIISSEFITSNTQVDKCPPPLLPEYAFIGRSNVGKSSLLNMLVDNSKLAKTSGKPGKTQLINHFKINEEWFLVDLPGYGFARVSREDRGKWDKMVKNYIFERPNLMCIFLLIDIRLEPQKIDLEFIEFLGEHGVPFVIVFTKADKLTRNETQSHLARYNKELKQNWEELPPVFVTSAEKFTGRDELLQFIDKTNNSFQPIK